MGGVLGERVDEIVKSFNASQDKYTVVATNKGNYDEVINGTIAAYRAKKAPQIVQIYERGFMTHAAVGRDRAGAGPADREEEQGRLVATSSSRWRAIYQYKGKLMSMPFNSSTPILLYNKEQFEKAGFEEPADTWQELEKQLYAIKQKGVRRVRLVAGRRLLLEPDGELQRGERPAVGHASRTAMTGSTPSSSTTRPGWSVRSTRLQKWVNDGIMQIAGQGLSPEQLFTSGKCATFFASTAAHGGIERDAKIKWSATYLPHEADLTRAQQQHRRRHAVGDEGPQGRGVRRRSPPSSPSSPAPTCSCGGTR